MLHLDSYYSLDSVHFDNSIQATVFLRIKNDPDGYQFQTYPFQYSS